MRRILRVFMSVPGRGKWLTLTGLLLATVAEGFGLASMLPALTILMDDGGEPTLVHKMVYGALDAVGLPHSLEVLLALVLVGVLAKAALVAVALIRVGYAVADVSTDLRTTVVRRLLEVKWGYFTRQPIGRFANAMSQDATRAGRAYMLSQMYLAAVLETVVSLTLAFLVSWRMALLAIAIGGTIILILGPFVKLSKKAGRRQQRSTQGFVTLLSDILIGIKPLKAMSRQEHFLPLFTRETASLRRALRRQAIGDNMVSEMREPIFMTFAVVGLYVAWAHFTVLMSELIVMAMLLYRTVGSLGRVQRQQQRAIVLEASHRAVHRLIDEVADEREEFKGTRQPTLERGCVFERVSFAFGAKRVLDEVSLNIPANRLTVLMGPSGVGKTTIADLLLGLYEPQGGRILVDGVLLGEIDLEAWRGMVGYVPQELVLFHDSVLANLTLGDPALGEPEALEALETAGAAAFVASLKDGLATTVGERGMQLSGGQRQRIALARALLIKPRLLILDEVTSALDPATEAAICENIQALDGKLTILAITHRPAWVEVADQVYEVGPAGVRLLTSNGPGIPAKDAGTGLQTLRSIGQEPYNCGSAARPDHRAWGCVSEAVSARSARSLDIPHSATPNTPMSAVQPDRSLSPWALSGGVEAELEPVTMTRHPKSATGDQAPSAAGKSPVEQGSILVTVGICTCNRDAFLAELLAGLEQIELGTLPPQAIEIVVVDNRPNDATRAVCEAAAVRLPVRLRYVAESKRGISLARNRVVAETLAADAKWLAFIDDDDWPEPDWLRHLVERQAVTGADIVMGNSKRELPKDASSSVTARLANQEITNDLPMWDRYGLPRRLATHNVLIRCSVLQRMAEAGPVFDPQFALMGGGDADFFCRARLAGVTFARAEDSFINYRLPSERLTMSGLVRRRFKKGVSQGILAQRYVTGRKRRHWLIKSSSRLLGSVLLLPFRLVSRDRLVQDVARITMTSGAFYGFLGGRYDYYSR